MEPDRKFIDIRTSDLTLSQMMKEISRLQGEYPEYEIFMDGDEYAIVGRRRNLLESASGLYRMQPHFTIICPGGCQL